jgi:hypothetical protein
VLWRALFASRSAASSSARDTFDPAAVVVAAVAPLAACGARALEGVVVAVVGRGS